MELWIPVAVFFVVIILLIIIIFIAKLAQGSSNWRRGGNNDCERPTTRCCKDGCPGKDGKCVIDFADFYAIQGCLGDAPVDNPTAIAPGEAILWPRDGPSKGTGNIIRNPDAALGGNTSILIKNPGVYDVEVVASITEADQIVLGLQNNVTGDTIVEQLDTVFGRSQTDTQTVLHRKIAIQQPNVNVSVRNPFNSTTSFTMTPCAGSSADIPSISSLSIIQLSQL